MDVGEPGEHFVFADFAVAIGVHQGEKPFKEHHLARFGIRRRFRRGWRQFGPWGRRQQYALQGGRRLRRLGYGGGHEYAD